MPASQAIQIEKQEEAVFAPTRGEIDKQCSLLREKSIIKPTFKRYIVLLLFSLNSCNKSFQWVSIPASTEKLTFYYGVDNYVINTASMMFMLAFVVLSAPACYTIDLIGIRGAVLIGSFGTAFGAVIKMFAYHEDGIYLVFVGQVMVSLGEQFIFSVPSRLAAVWFPDRQVSTALSLMVFGQQAGCALGFFIPDRLLNGAETKDEIELGMYRLFTGCAAFSVCVFLACLWLFDEEPKNAPGAARLKQIHDETVHRQENPRQGFWREMALLWDQICLLMVDKNVSLLVISYGVNLAVIYSTQTVLNQMLEPLWPGDDNLVGNTGFIMATVGAFSLLVVGRLMDALHQYKLINVMLNLLTILLLVFFTYVIVGLKSAWSIYLGAGMLSFFQTALMATGLEYAVELTYPAPQLVISSLMNLMPNMMGAAMVFVASYLVDNFGDIVLMSFFIFCCGLATVLLLCTRETLNRQKAALGDKKVAPIYMMQCTPPVSLRSIE